MVAIEVADLVDEIAVARFHHPSCDHIRVTNSVTKINPR